MISSYKGGGWRKFGPSTKSQFEFEGGDKLDKHGNFLQQKNTKTTYQAKFTHLSHTQQILKIEVWEFWIYLKRL